MSTSAIKSDAGDRKSTKRRSRIVVTTTAITTAVPSSSSAVAAAECNRHRRIDEKQQSKIVLSVKERGTKLAAGRSSSRRSLTVGFRDSAARFECGIDGSNCNPVESAGNLQPMGVSSSLGDRETDVEDVVVHRCGDSNENFRRLAKAKTDAVDADKPTFTASRKSSMSTNADCRRRIAVKANASSRASSSTDCGSAGVKPSVLGRSVNLAEASAVGGRIGGVSSVTRQMRRGGATIANCTVLSGVSRRQKSPRFIAELIVRQPPSCQMGKAVPTQDDEYEAYQNDWPLKKHAESKRPMADAKLAKEEIERPPRPQHQRHRTCIKPPLYRDAVIECKSLGCETAGRIIDGARKMSYAQTNIKDRHRKLRRPSKDSTYDVATESSSEHLAFPSVEVAKSAGKKPAVSTGNVNADSMRPSCTSKIKTEDAEQSGIDADQSSSDDCDGEHFTEAVRQNTSSICDVTYVVNVSERDACYQIPGSRIDPKTALTIAYDIESSDYNNSSLNLPNDANCSTLLAARACSSGGVQLSETIDYCSKLKLGCTDAVCADGHEVEPLIQLSMGSTARLHQLSGGGNLFRHDCGNESSFGILPDVRLKDNSLLPLSQLSPAAACCLQAIDAIDELMLRELPVDCIESETRGGRGGELFNHEPNNAISRSTSSVDFNPGTNCVTSTPRLSPSTMKKTKKKKKSQSHVSHSSRPLTTSKLCDERETAGEVLTSTDDENVEQKTLLLAFANDNCNRKPTNPRIDKPEAPVVVSAVNSAADCVESESSEQLITESLAAVDISNGTAVKPDGRISFNSSFSGPLQLESMGTGDASKCDAESCGARHLRHQSGVASLSDGKLDFEAFDDDDFLSSQLLLLSEACYECGAGEEVAPMNMDGDGEIFSSRSARKAGENQWSIASAVAPSKISIGRSTDCLRPGAGETFAVLLPVDSLVSPDVFCNWSFSSLARPASAESDGASTGVACTLRPSSTTGDHVVSPAAGASVAAAAAAATVSQRQQGARAEQNEHQPKVRHRESKSAPSAICGKYLVD
jgi:hypothetical protein